MRTMIYFWWLLLLCLPATAARGVHFSQVSASGGMSQNTVRALAVDRNGFVWAGTLDGLNRYDGYRIRSYQLQTLDQCDLNDHRIRHLYATRDSSLWARTYLGEFSYYDPQTDTFTHVTDDQGQPATFTYFREAANGDIWLWGGSEGAMRLRHRAEGGFAKQRFLQSGENCAFLLEDSRGAVWAGGWNGLKQISHDGNTTEHPAYPYYFTQAQEVDGKVCFSTREGRMLVYDPAKDSFSEATLPSADAIIDLFRLSHTELLALTRSQGAWVFNVRSLDFRPSELNNETRHFTNEVRSAKDSRGDTWLYQTDGKVWFLNSADGSIRRFDLSAYRHRFADPTDRLIFYLENVLVDSEGLYWVMSYGYGLFCYDATNDVLTHYSSQTTFGGLTSNYLLSIAEDNYGNLWLGSEYTGLIRITKNPDYVGIMHPEEGNIVGKRNNVRSIFEDSRGNIWIGLKNGGLYVYHPDLTLKTCIDKSLNPYAIVEDDKGRVWVGSKNYGVMAFSVDDYRRLAHLNHRDDDPTSLLDKAVFHLLKDRSGRIWAASFERGGVGLIREGADGRFSLQNFLYGMGNRSMVRYLYQDQKDRIWVGTCDGLIRFHPDELIANPEAYTCYNMDLSQPHSLSNNDIKFIFQDSEGRIWIGTAGGGLNQFVEGDGTAPDHFISFTAADGLPDNYVLSILEDGDQLWLSSEHGLSRFSKTDHTVVNYQFAQEPYANIYNEAACLRLRNGATLWGTLDGLMIFHPDKFRPDAHTPPVLLTGLTVDGTDWNRVKPASQKNAITFTQEIELDYQQNVFTLEFASLNLRNPEQNQYTYILDGFDKNWSAPSSANTAAYKNVPPGDYVFRVKGANSFGVWNEAVTTLAITIHPPLWQSPAARCLYVLLALLAFYIAFRLMVKFARLKSAVEMEKQLTDHKLRFFTNISHEFRTPLTIIQGSVEQLDDMSDLSQAAHKQVRVLSRNVRGLRELIDQLLEFRKLQNGTQRLDMEELDMVRFARDIFSGFQEMALQKAIDYRFVCKEEALPLFIDRKKIDKVIYNLLSNAFKFTPRGGSIGLCVEHDEKRGECILSVKDNGMGIPREKRHLLFSRFSQANFSATGTGVGLSMVKEFVEVHKGRVEFEDNPGGGSIFRVRLSTSRETYAGENFVTAPEAFVATPAEGESSEESQVALSAYRLLIVDDNDDIREFLRDGFSHLMTVDTAVDGQEGLQKAIDTNPDLIICDVMMPQMDGLEVTRRLKGDFQTCHIPIILVTALSSPDQQLEGIDSGADAYITKPFSLKYVQKRVTKMVEQREMLKKRFSQELTLDKTQTSSADQEFFEKVEKILDEHFADSSFTIDRFIELSGIRRTLFFKKVKGITGFSPNDLIKMKRLNRAADLLREGDFNVSEVSYRVGFEDPFYFSKCFKQQFGCSPKSFHGK